MSSFLYVQSIEKEYREDNSNDISIDLTANLPPSVVTIDKSLDPLSARHYQIEMDVQTSPRLDDQRSEVR